MKISLPPEGIVLADDIVVTSVTNSVDVVETGLLLTPTLNPFLEVDTVGTVSVVGITNFDPKILLYKIP